ncbi:MAG: class I SAM-dependent DNA methyltransferase [Ilumatobacteraceae bacterium]
MDLDKAYSVKTPEDSRRLYAEWASTYNETFIKANDYVYPRTIAQKFDELIPKSDIQTVVDIGCGTGAVGSYLANLRPNLKITGVDISAEMLAEASKLKRIDGSPVYRDLIEVDLTAELPKKSFDAMISAGTFTHGHLGAETFISLIALVRFNGWLVIGINAEHFLSQGFGSALQNAQDQGLTTHAQFHNVQIYGPKSAHYGDLATIAIFQRLK